ncbi:MAG: hypothetical protein E7352_06670 [Clostridiales bacterium]|nr:hypothetical protein [Clostridiales bacterium]
MKKIVVGLISILSASAFLFTGCDNGNANPSGPVNVPKTEASINITDSSLALDCFDSYTFELKTENVGEVTWTSSDPSLLSVDANGKATTNIKEGKVTVTAKSGNLSDTCEVTVVRKQSLPTFVVENDITISEGDSYALSLYMYYGGQDITDYVTFACDAVDETQEAVSATVSGNEVLFTGNALGKTEFTVYTTVYGQLLAESVNVTVKNTDLVYALEGAVDNQLCLTSAHDVYTSDISLYYKGEKVPSDSLDWTVSNEAIVTIGEGGKLLAGKEGVTNLTLSYQGVDISVAVRVIKDRVAVSVEQEEAEFINLDTLITATQIVYPTEGERKYEINESNTASFSLSETVTEGEIVEAWADNVQLDESCFSYADGVVTVQTKAFGLDIYGEKVMRISVETSDTIYEYALNTVIVTKELTNLTDFKTAISIQWKGDTIYGYYTLASDMDFNWYEISCYATDWNWMHGFRGTLDGRGHSILNFKTVNYGLTAQSGEGAVFKNIKFPNVRYNGGETTIFGRGVVGATIENIEITTTEDSAFNVAADIKSCGILISHEMRRCTFRNITIHAEGRSLQKVFGGMGNEKNTSVYENVKIYASSVTQYEYDMTTAPAGVELITSN